MAALFRRPSLDPRVVPTVPVKIDWSHPLAQGLVFLCVPAAIAGPLDLKGGLPLLVAGVPEIIVGANGPGIWTPGTGGGLYSATLPPSLQFDTYNFSFFTKGGFLGGSLGGANPTIFGVMLTASPYLSYGFVFSGSGSNLLPQAWLAVNSNGWITAQASGAPTNQNLPDACLVGTVTTTPSNLFTIYVNNSTGSSSWGSGAPQYSPNPQLTIGEQTANGRSANFRTDICGIFGRTLTADEAAWLPAEPFAMLRPKVRRSFFLPASATPFAGIAIPGTLAASAPAAALSAGVALAATAGNIAASSPAPVLSAGATLAAGFAGAPVASPIAALSAGFAGAASAASMPAIAASPALSAGASLLASPGAFVAAGYAASFSSSSPFLGAAQPGAFGAIAYVPQLAAGAVLAAQPGQAATNAPTPTVAAGFAGAASAATLPASATIASLSAPAMLLAPGAALAIAGIPASLSAGASLAARPGAFAAAGYAATFTGGPQLAPDFDVLWSAIVPAEQWSAIVPAEQWSAIVPGG